MDSQHDHRRAYEADLEYFGIFSSTTKIRAEVSTTPLKGHLQGNTVVSNHTVASNSTVDTANHKEDMVSQGTVNHKEGMGTSSNSRCLNNL